MKKTNSIIMLFSLFFVALFLLSIFVPNAGYTRTENNYETSPNAQFDKMEKEIKEQQHKYYKSREEDEAEYYRSVAPHDMDNPDYFQRSHPLQEKPLEERPLQEKPLQERPLQEKPLQEKLLR